MTSCSHTLEKGDDSSRGGVLILTNAVVSAPAQGTVVHVRPNVITVCGSTSTGVVICGNPTYVSRTIAVDNLSTATTDVAMRRQTLTNLTSTGTTQTPSIIDLAESNLANSEQACQNAAKEAFVTGAIVGAGLGSWGIGLAGLESVGIVIPLTAAAGLFLEIAAFGTVALSSLIGVAISANC